MNDNTYSVLMEIEERKKEPQMFSYRLQFNYYDSHNRQLDLKSAQAILTIEAKNPSEAATKGLNMKPALFGEEPWILHSVDRWDAYNYNGPG